MGGASQKDVNEKNVVYMHIRKKGQIRGPEITDCSRGRLQETNDRTSGRTHGRTNGHGFLDPPNSCTYPAKPSKSVDFWSGHDFGTPDCGKEVPKSRIVVGESFKKGNFLGKDTLPKGNTDVRCFS